MEEKIFQVCLNKYNGILEKSWDELAEEFGYKNGELLRNNFRYEKRITGIKKEEKDDNIKNKVNACVYDLELSPMKVYSFGLWEQNISPDNIISDFFIISWSLKMLNEAVVYSDVLTPTEALECDDSRICKSIWSILNNCSIRIGHNVNFFDRKKLNTRFLYNGLPPISDAKIVDTLLLARSNFSFSSNTLKYINRGLGIKQKIENEGMKLWIDCMNGEKQSLEKMKNYCEGDVLATEELYYKLRPYIKNLNMAMYNEIEKEQCPVCGGINLKSEGFYYTTTGKYETLRCLKCKSVSRRKTNVLSKEKRGELLKK